MKRKIFILRIKEFSLFLLAAAIFLAACSKQTGSVQETEAVKEAESELVSAALNAEETETSSQWIFGEPESSAQAIDDGNYISISEIDGDNSFEKDGFVFLDAAEFSFLEIGGIEEPKENENRYYRLKVADREIYSVLNEAFAECTPGVTLRFRTDAEKIKIRMMMSDAQTHFYHITGRGAYGIDIYTGTGTKRTYCGNVMQNMTEPKEIDENVTLPGGYTEVMINFPQYSGVSKVLVGFPYGAEVAEPTKRSREPVLFYGSSVTEGASASRPGNAYTNILCRSLDCDCINLGFSGSDLGEQEIADYITTRDFAVFVMDYNNNATPEILRNTHYNFYRTVRDAKPDVPIIIVSKPVLNIEPNEEEQEKEEIILETYNRALGEGDENVYFISGMDFFPEENRDLFSVDRVHPNDLGHYYMAKTIYPLLRQVIDGAE